MKKITTLFISLVAVLAMVKPVMADGTETKETCTTNSYGETTCTTTTTTSGDVVVHEPVEAAIGDLNPLVLTALLLGGGYVTLRMSRKMTV